MVNLRFIKVVTKLFLISCLLPAVANATIYYVDGNLGADCTSGNYSIASRNCSGSDGNAYNTFQEGVNIASPGDTVYFRAGTYYEHITDASSSSGTSGNPITYQSYDGETVIVDGTVNSTDAVVKFSGTNYIIWDDIDVRNGNLRGAWFSGSYNIIRNSKFYDNGSMGETSATGLTVIECDHNIIDSVEAYNNGWNGISAEQCNYTTIKYCKSHGNSEHQGIQLFQNYSEPAETWTGNNLYYNEIYENSNGIFSLHQINNAIIGNVVYNNDDDGILLDDTGQGLSSYDSYTKLYNNTFYGNGRYGIQNRTADYMDIKNNIISNNVSGCIYTYRTEGMDIDYNLFYGTMNFRWGGSYPTSFASWKSTSSQDANSINDNPDFTDSGNGDFTLLAVSPAINAGTWPVVTTSSGSGSQIPVNNAEPFVIGGVIQFQGQSTTATVVDVNASTNIVTANKSLSWSSGLGLWYSYSGSIVDMGYDEYTSSPPASDPVITITDPTSSATYNTTDASDTISGDAIDSDGTIASVAWVCPQCTPSSGSATADDGTFDENDDPWTTGSITFDDGINVITFTVTDNDANTGVDVITVTKGQEGVIEVEDCTLAGNMSASADANASGGYYVSTSVANSGTATCSVTINEAGYYKFATNVYATGVAANSFFVNVDEASSTASEYIWDINSEENSNLWSVYYEDEISKRGAGAYNNPEEDPLVIYLSSGAHNVVFTGRETGTRLDYFYPVLAPNPNTEPVSTITIPTTSNEIVWDSSLRIQGNAAVSGATISSATYSIICNGAAFDSGSLTADDASWDEASETWTLDVSGMPIGSCVVSIISTDSGANSSDAELLTVNITPGRPVGAAY